VHGRREQISDCLFLLLSSIPGNANNFDDMASFWRFEREQAMKNKANRKFQQPIDG